MKAILALLLFAAPLGVQTTAQPNPMNPPPVAEWPGAEIVDGVAFQADGSVTLEAGASGLPVIAFWRPILFNEDTDRPYAGRMDCRVVAADGYYSDIDFDPDARHEAVREARARQGFRDEDVLRDIGDTIRQIDVVGRRNNPHQHYVLSYIMVRDGERLIDIRRNCTFVHDDAISRVDVLPYVYRYTKLTFAFEPSTGGDG